VTVEEINSLFKQASESSYVVSALPDQQAVSVITLALELFSFRG